MAEYSESTPGERLKYVRKQLLKLTRKAFTEKYDLSEDTLKSWENCRTRLTEKGLQRCIKIYRHAGVNLSEDWILTGEGLDPNISVDLSCYINEPRAVYESSALSDEMLLLKEIDFFKRYPRNDEQSCSI